MTKAIRWTHEQLADYSRKGKVAPKPVKKPNKFGAVKTDGYHSKKEAGRAAMLKAFEAGGLIRGLREQVKYVLIPKQEGERECSYIADFVYEEGKQPGLPDDGTVHWLPVTEDCKGYRDAVYRIKRKLMLHVHGIRIRET